MDAKRVGLLVMLAVACIGPSTGSAQTGAHIMVNPSDLKWADVPSLPPGARLPSSRVR